MKTRLEYSDPNSQLMREKMEIRLEKPALNNFKVYGWQKWKTYTGGFKVKERKSFYGEQKN